MRSRMWASCSRLYAIARWSVSHWETVWPDGGSFSTIFFFFFLTPPFFSLSLFFNPFSSSSWFGSLQLFSKESWEGQTQVCLALSYYLGKINRHGATPHRQHHLAAWIINRIWSINKSGRSGRCVAYASQMCLNNQILVAAVPHIWFDSSWQHKREREFVHNWLTGVGGGWRRVGIGTVTTHLSSGKNRAGVRRFWSPVPVTSFCLTVEHFSQQRGETSGNGQQGKARWGTYVSVFTAAAARYNWLSAVILLL